MLFILLLSQWNLSAKNDNSLTQLSYNPSSKIFKILQVSMSKFKGSSRITYMPLFKTYPRSYLLFPIQINLTKIIPTLQSNASLCQYQNSRGDFFSKIWGDLQPRLGHREPPSIKNVKRLCKVWWPEDKCLRWGGRGGFGAGEGWKKEGGQVSTLS